MKILVVNPPRVNGYPVVREERFEHKDMGSVYPPLSLLHTASVLEKAGHDVSLVDANGFDIKLSGVKQKITKLKPEMVIIRCGFDTQKQDLKVLKFAKRKGAMTVLRNHIISRTPGLRDKIVRENRFVDVFLNQEPERIVCDLADAIEKKKSLKKVSGISFFKGRKVVTNKDSTKEMDLDKIPYPAYHLLPNLDVYYSGTFGPPFVTLLGSRGCPFSCAFCAYGGVKYRSRSAKSIADEIEWLSQEHGIREFCFLDDVVTINPERMIKISKEIIKKNLDLRWSVGIRATSVTKPMIEHMKRAGCDEIAVGIESGSPEMLKRINKGVTVDDVRRAAKICKNVGVKFYAMFIIGLPGETRESAMQSINLAKELRSFYTQFCFATPFPNTRIYEYYNENKFLLTNDSSKYFPLNQQPVVRTDELSRRDLVNLKNLAYRKTLFDPVYLLSHVSLTDWKWNIRGAKELGKRLFAALNLKPVR